MRKLLALVLITTLSLGPIACSSRAAVETNPSAGAVSASQLDAKRITDEVRRTVAVIRILRNQAEALTQTPAEPKNLITKAQMDAVDKAAIATADKLKAALQVLEQVVSQPSLVNTAKTVVDAVDQFIVALPNVPGLKFLVEIVVSGIELSRTISKAPLPAVLFEGGR